MANTGRGALMGVAVRSGKRRRAIKIQTWLLAGASVLALAMAAPAAAQTVTGTPGITATASTSGVVAFNAPTSAVVRVDTYAVQFQGTLQGQVIFDQTTPSIAEHFQSLGPGGIDAGAWNPERDTGAAAEFAIISAAGNAPGLFIYRQVGSIDTTLLSSNVVTTYSLNSTTPITTAEIVVGPGTTTIGSRSDCSSVSALPSTTRPACVAGTPTTFNVISGEVNTNTNVETTYLVDQTLSGTQTYVTTQHDTVTGTLIAPGGTFTGLAGETLTTSSSASIVFNAPTEATTRVDATATHMQGTLNGQVVFDMTRPGGTPGNDAGTVGFLNFTLPNNTTTTPFEVIAAAANFAPGLYISYPTYVGADTALQSSNSVTSYSLNSTEVTSTSEVAIGPGTTQIGVRSACDVSALPSTTQPVCNGGNPTTLTVVGGEINVNLDTHTAYTIDQTRTTTNNFLTTYNYNVVGTVIAAGATVTGGGPTTETYSSSASLIFNAPTNASTRIDTYSTELIGQLAGAQVFDQTYNAAFSDASVQQGLDDARAAIQAAGHGRAVLIAEPVRTASATTLIGSTSTTTYTLASQTQTATAGVTVGPGVVQFGVLSACDAPTGASATRPTCTTGAASTLNVVGGQVNTNVNIDTVSTIDTTITGTDTYLTSEQYLISAVFAAYGRVHPAAQIMALEQSASFLSAIADGDVFRGNARALDGAGRWRLFLEAAGQRQDFDAHRDIAASDGAFAGLRGGAAFALNPQWTIGLIGEEGQWHWDGHDRLLPEQARNANSWRLAGFAEWRGAPWRLTLVGFTGQQTVKSITDSGAGSAEAQYTGSLYGAGARLGRGFAVGGIVLTPSVGIDWLRWDAGAFTERGGLAPLSIRSATRDQTRLHAGLALNRQSGRWDVGAYLRGTLTSGDRRGRVIASDGVSAEGDFAIDGPTADSRQAEIGGHIDFTPQPGLLLGLSAAARAGEQTKSYGVQFGVRLAL